MCRAGGGGTVCVEQAEPLLDEASSAVDVGV
jgi:hypothetical protein